LAEVSAAQQPVDRPTSFSETAFCDCLRKRSLSLIHCTHCSELLILFVIVMTSTISCINLSSTIIRLPFEAVHVDACLRWLDAVYNVMTTTKINEKLQKRTESDFLDLQSRARISVQRGFVLPSSDKPAILSIQFQPTQDHEELVRDMLYQKLAMPTHQLA
jgi:hypothetical protein